MKRRTLCLLLAGVMALSVLSGCGGKTAGGDQPNTPDNSPVETGGNIPDNVPNNEAPMVPPDDWEDTAQPEDDLPFPRDPRWAELQPGETAAQYYDIFIKSGMTVGEAVEAIEGSDAYQEQFITWEVESDPGYSGTKYAKLDTELTCEAAKSIKIGSEVVTEKGLSTGIKSMSVQGSGETIMALRFVTDLPGEEGTVYHVSDLPILWVSTPSNAAYSTLAFMGPNGSVKDMGRQDVENLLDAAFKVREPNTELVADRTTIEGKGFYTYKFYSHLPLSLSWNGYTFWSCPQGEEPAMGIVTVSSFTISADNDRPRSRNGWSLDLPTPSCSYYWAADDAG